MEEVFKFLLVAAAIGIGLVKQFKKEANKDADKSPGTPVPDAGNPLPEYWGGDTYGGFIPKGPKGAKPKPAKKPKPASGPSAKSRHTPMKTPPPPTASRLQESGEATSEYGIHSAEEARKAIIWSEILQRKY